MKILNNQRENIEVINPMTIECHNDNQVYIDNLHSNLNIKLYDNSSLILNAFIVYKNKEVIEINVLSENNTNFEFNISYIAYNSVDLIIKYYMTGDNNKCNVIIKSISDESGKSKIVITGTVDKDTNDNEMNENIRIITKNNEENIVIPNMIISTENVMANHSATIGKIDENELNYLMSKGLSKRASEQLIENGFLISNLKIDKEELIKITDFLLNRK